LKEARRDADRLVVEAWNKRLLGFQGSAQPSPTLGDALNAGYGYLEEFGVWAATRTRPLPSTLCADRSARRSMNWNATCGARTAQKCAAIRTNGAIWSRCAQAIRPRRGGRGSDNAVTPSDFLTDVVIPNVDALGNNAGDVRLATNAILRRTRWQG